MSGMKRRLNERLHQTLAAHNQRPKSLTLYSCEGLYDKLDEKICTF